tara:strand:- start:139 stop:621 length:483 start_codon:yes stop_codon:yes gene_type:complete
MATTQASLTIGSNITDYGFSLSKTMTMTKHTTATRVGDGLEFTSGLVRRTFTSTNHIDLITSGAQNYGTPTASDSNAANKIYIKNTGTSSTDFFEIGLGTSSGSDTATTDAIGGTHLALGKLYGGDWLLIPGHLKATVGDITIKPSTAEKMSVEYMVFFE